MGTIIPQENGYLKPKEKLYSGPCPICLKARLDIADGEEITCPHCGIIVRATWIEPLLGSSYLLIEYKVTNGRDPDSE